MLRATLTDCFSFRRHFGHRAQPKINFSAKSIARRPGTAAPHRVHQLKTDALIARETRDDNIRRNNRLINNERDMKQIAAQLVAGRRGASHSADGMAAARAALQLSLAARQERKASKLRHYEDAAALKRDYRKQRGSSPFG